jgi:hypothetical protein
MRAYLWKHVIRNEALQKTPHKGTLDMGGYSPANKPRIGEERIIQCCAKHSKGGFLHLHFKDGVKIEEISTRVRTEGKPLHTEPPSSF